MDSVENNCKLPASRHRHFRNINREPATYCGPSGVDPLFNVNVIVTCKGRLNHLKVTLKPLLGILPPRGRVIVVDYGDPDGAFEYCVQLAHPRLIAMKVLDNAELFNLSRARNCGANLLPSDILCFVDADSLLHSDFFSQATIMLRDGRAVLTKRDVQDRRFDTCGLCCIKTESYRLVRGYDEAFQGWAPEDVDFYERVRRVGIVHNFPAMLYPITLPHSDAERTRFYATKDRRDSEIRGRQLMAQSEREVNPHGYGRAMTTVFGLVLRNANTKIWISETVDALNMMDAMI